MLVVGIICSLAVLACGDSIAPRYLNRGNVAQGFSEASNPGSVSVVAASPIQKVTYFRNTPQQPSIVQSTGFSGNSFDDDDNTFVAGRGFPLVTPGPSGRYGTQRTTSIRSAILEFVRLGEVIPYSILNGINFKTFPTVSVESIQGQEVEELGGEVSYSSIFGLDNQAIPFHTLSSFDQGFNSDSSEEEEVVQSEYRQQPQPIRMQTTPPSSVGQTFGGYNVVGTHRYRVQGDKISFLGGTGDVNIVEPVAQSQQRNQNEQLIYSAPTFGVSLGSGGLVGRKTFTNPRY